MTSSASVPVRTDWKPTDKWLLGIALAVINFWLFAQTLLNVIPGIERSKKEQEARPDEVAPPAFGN